MSEEELKELQEYNLEYLEAQNSEEIFGGDYTSEVELKYAKKEIEKLNNIIEELKEWLISDIKMFEKLKEDNDKEYYLGRITTAKKVLSYFEKGDDE